MNKLYSEINEKTNGKYADLRFPNVALGDVATVSVVCAEDRLNEVKSGYSQLKSAVSEICAFNVPTELDIKPQKISARALRDITTAFMAKFPYVGSAAETVTAEISPECSVKMKMHKSMYALAKEGFLPRLEEFYANNFVERIKVSVDVTDYAPNGETGDAIRTYAVDIGDPVIGIVGEKSAVSAACVSGNNKNIAVCGVLTMPTEFLSKGNDFSKPRLYEKFLLCDGETSLHCKYFIDDGVKIDFAKCVNKTVCAVGNTTPERGRTDETVMFVNALALCNAPELKPQGLPEVPKNYETVTPVPYEEYVQASLFDVREKLPPSLEGAFVAFDFETTGLSVRRDKPTEIGAVKFVNGAITETFTTLIDPQRHIPDEVAQKTGITNEMVKGQPLIDDVLPDFYKFTHGCKLVAHNIAFDFPFLIKYGNRYGWVFGDRITFDTQALAPRALKGIDVLTLARVTEMLGIVNDTAHRALSDAIATAKAFIAMQKRLA
ncbi:MAG: 3'-5' exonuclease [Roseburia sp.]|nr:3'-5' exonuclease [Roseburia sp.]